MGEEWGNRLPAWPVHRSPGTARGLPLQGPVMFGFESYHILLAAVGVSIILSFWLPRFISGREPARIRATVHQPALSASHSFRNAGCAEPDSGAAALGDRQRNSVSSSGCSAPAFGSTESRNASSGCRRCGCLQSPCLCIALVALVGWTIAGMTLAGGLLLGAILAPTDRYWQATFRSALPTKGEHPVRYANDRSRSLPMTWPFPSCTWASRLQQRVG